MIKKLWLACVTSWCLISPTIFADNDIANTNLDISSKDKDTYINAINSFITNQEQSGNLTIPQTVNPPINANPDVNTCGDFIDTTPFPIDPKRSYEDKYLHAFRVLNCRIQLFLNGINGTTVNLNNNLNAAMIKTNNQVYVDLLKNTANIIFSFDTNFSWVGDVIKKLGGISDPKNLANYYAAIRTNLAGDAKDNSTLYILNEMQPNFTDAHDVQNIKDFKTYAAQFIPPAKLPEMYAKAQNIGSLRDDERFDLLLHATRNMQKQTLSNINITKKNFVPLWKHMQNDSDFQSYMAQALSVDIFKMLYLNNIYQIAAERTPDGNGDSIASLEHTMATGTLSDKYLSDLSKASLATVNVETLKALNKLVYFLNKIHIDNERMLLMQSITGLQSLSAITQTSDTKLKTVDEKALNYYCDVVLGGDAAKSGLCAKAQGQ